LNVYITVVILKHITPLYGELQIHHCHAIEAMIICERVPDPSWPNYIVPAIMPIFNDTPIRVSSKLYIYQNGWINS